MKRKLLTSALAIMLTLSLFGCGSSSTPSSTASQEPVASQENSAESTQESTTGKDVSVIMVTMDGLDNHWVNANKGATAAASELGINYQWMTPDKKDTALQIEILNNAIAAKPDVLIVAAVDPNAIVSTLESAANAGIQIIYVDSTANFEAAAKFTTDNYAAAKQAGEQLLAAFNDKGITSGDIGIVAFSNATQTSVDREQGFRDVFEGTDFNLLQTQYGNSEVAASQSVAENFISQGVVGLYGNNEPGAVGVGNAVAASTGWEGVAVGFDASETTLDLVENGSLYCVMAQNPYQMGYGAVSAAYKLANGETLTETSVDTGANVVTAANASEFRAG